MTYHSKLVAGLHLDFFLNISILFINGILYTLCTMHDEPYFCIDNSYHLCLYGVEVFSQLDEPFIIVRILWAAPAQEEKTRQTQRVVQRLVHRVVKRLVQRLVQRDSSHLISSARLARIGVNVLFVNS